MMINKRLIGTVKESKKYIAGNVICQWISLAANIAMMGAIAHMLQNLYEGNTQDGQIGLTAVTAIAAVIIRFACAVISSRMGYLSSRAVKKTLREMIYKKLLRLGTSYKEQANTSEVVQVRGSERYLSLRAGRNPGSFLKTSLQTIVPRCVITGWTDRFFHFR